MQTAGIHHQNLIRLGQARALEHLVQIHIGEEGLELSHGIEVVRLVHVAQLLVAVRGSGELSVSGPEGVRLGRSVGFRLAHQGQQGADVGQIGRLLGVRGSFIPGLPQQGGEGAELQQIVVAVLVVDGQGETHEKTHTGVLIELVRSGHQFPDALGLVDGGEIGLDGGDTSLIPGVDI